ncbi:hypothetical protein F5Y07DRAFT_381898 [Xylaria sp. FL0933]|nr:hypothetical protein F5Y07DRAFT_381898 [Xylaria sp. FL0933]
MERESIIPIARWVLMQKILVWVIRGYLDSTIDQNTRHGTLLSSIHRYGLHLQSRVLGKHFSESPTSSLTPRSSEIPPKFGPFTPDAPALRICQAKYACAIAFIFCLVPICAGFATWRVSPDALEFPWPRILRAWAGMLAFGIVVVCGLAIAACCSDTCYEHRAATEDDKKTTQQRNSTILHMCLRSNEGFDLGIKNRIRGIHQC